jgi:hypothetical protein
LLFRNDRDGHGGKSIAYTNADAHAHTNAYGDTYTHIYTDASPVGYPNSHAYANGHGNRHTYANGHSYGDGHAYADGFTDGYSYADALHGKMYADAEAGSDSGAASHATASDSCDVHSRSYAEPRARGSYGCRK